MINFKYVRWKNFLSTGNQPTEIQLDKNPTTLIIGENGAGKSTVLDALCFGLFGKPFRTISKSQLVNSINNGATMVEIEFSIGTVEYKVMRGIKPNKFEIYQNGKMMNQEANVRDYQKILEQNILKLNYGSFTQVVILGSSTFVPFMQLKARHRREVVEEILDIKIFSTMNLILKGKLKTLLEDIRDIDYQYELTAEKINLQENLIADLKQNKDKIIKQKQKLIDTNAEEIKSRVEEKLMIEQENTNLLDTITDRLQAEKKQEKLKQIRATLSEKVATHEKIKTFFVENEDCPTCEQHIDENFKENMIAKKDEEKEELEEGLSKLKTVLDEVFDRVGEIKKTTKIISDNQVSLAKINTSIKELEKFNVKLQTEIDQYTKDGAGKNDTDKLTTLSKEYVEIAKQRTKLKETKVYYEAARSMLTDTGIKTKIIKQYLPIMNKLINKYSDFYGILC